MNVIIRSGSPDNRMMSRFVIYNDVVYLSGVTARRADGPPPATFEEQVEVVLRKIDTTLEEAGSNRRHMLQALVFLRNSTDFHTFNKMWDAWVPEGCSPAQTCVEAGVPRQLELMFEVQITAAVAR